ncbi:MAG: thiol peroxidase [Caldilineaceae bacterium]|nr:thiol peroxidase [Caldilineaceae bacterium]MBP8107267.1 thiol peroxidase [Caldilineaceae bacterium]MBP8122368.1 thiol peroxidase [Caldilineaceae bacterium]MBP9071081.1 thiol peroxidase [Caldilineaceae bacterium]
MSRTVTLKGNPVSAIYGEPLQVGQAAPAAAGRNNAFSTATFDVINDTQGKIRVLNFVPSLNTGICDAQTRRFNVDLDQLKEQVAVVTISVDLPFVQKNWCGAAGLEEAIMVSDYFDMAIGKAYGTYLLDLRLEQRGIVVVDAEGTVRYTEYCPEIGMHTDYDAALAAVKALL